MPFARTLLALGAAAVLAAGAAQAQTAGFTPGTFNVDDGGAATYTIPITLAPGIAGMEPKLALAYSSRLGNGRLGMGWALGGLSAIARCPRTLARDGQSGGVNIDANDRFCLDGQRLMVTSGSYGAAASVYSTERESFSKITANGAVGSGPDWFEVRTKSGLILEYGNGNNSKFQPQGAPAVLVWGVSKIRDSKGNYLTVTYAYDNPPAPTDWYPDRIEYTFNPAGGVTTPNQSVTFEYEEGRSDAIPMYVAGVTVRTTNRLVRIKNSVQATLVREYRLAYNNDGTPARSRLTSVQECNSAGACLPVTTFTVQTSNAAGFNESGGSTSYIRTTAPRGMVTGDFNGDGKTDLAEYSSGSAWRICTSIGSLLSCDTRSAHSGGMTNNFLGDFNGDGKTDLLAFSSGSSWDVCLSTGTGFTCSLWTGHGYGLASTVVDDFDGDGRTDIAGYTGSSGLWQVCLSTGAGFSCGSWSGHGDGVSNNMSGDFNGDGKTDIAGYGGNAVWHVCLSTGAGFNCGSWNGHGGGSSNTLVGDFNGDGKTDTAGRTLDAGGLPVGNQWNVCLSTGAGFTCANNLAINPKPTQETIAGDFNGDGRTDLAAMDPNEQTWQVCYGLYASGTTFNCVTVPSSVWPATGSAARVKAGDLNGDGLSDLADYRVESFVSEGINQYSVEYDVALNGALYPDLVTKVTNGLGHETNISYSPLTNSAVYTKDSDAAYPDVDFQGPLQVVRSASSANGLGGWITTDYLYGGAKVNAKDGHGFKGFRWREVTAQASGIKTRTHYRQDHPYIGLPSMVKRTHPNATVLLQSGTEYGCKDFVLASGCLAAPGKRYFPYVAQSAERAKDLNGAAFPMVSTATQYDDFGNATTVTANAADGFTKVTTNTYAAPDTTSWILGRLIRTTVQSTIPTSPPPPPGGPGVSLSPSPLNISSGVFEGTAAGTSSATTTGGMPPFTYSWSRLTGSRISVSGKQTATFSTTVNYGDNSTETFRLTATDADGAVATSELSVTATGPAWPPPSVTAIPASGTTTITNAGTRSRDVTAYVSNGAPPFTYAWTNLPGSEGSLTNTSSQTVTVRLTTPACDSRTALFRITVTDALNRTASSDASWTLVSSYCP